MTLETSSLLPSKIMANGCSRIVIFALMFHMGVSIAFSLQGHMRRHNHHAVRYSSSPLASATRELIHLDDEKAYNAKIEEAKRENQVVVIKVYASWCRACKAMAPKYQRIAEDWPDVEFCDILFDNNKNLCKSLGIKVLPYVEIIAGGKGKVEGFSCGPSKVSQLQEKLEVHGRGELIPCSNISTLLDDY